MCTWYDTARRKLNILKTKVFKIRGNVNSLRVHSNSLHATFILHQNRRTIDKLEAAICLKITGLNYLFGVMYGPEKSLSQNDLLQNHLVNGGVDFFAQFRANLVSCSKRTNLQKFHFFFIYFVTQITSMLLTETLWAFPSLLNR